MKDRRAIALLALLATACGQNKTLPGVSPYSPHDDAVFECLPNLDGVLESGDVLLGVGFHQLAD